MAIPESQLETWSHQAAITTSKNTYASIKGSLEAKDTSYAGRDFRVFLQGSYGNDTNIRADSDVDIVIVLTSIWRADTSELPPDQVRAYQRAFSDATYRFSDFKNAVVSQLERTYGYQNVWPGNKSVKTTASSSRLGAGVVVCHEYRYYRHFYGLINQSYDEGIIFPTGVVGGEVINYPSQHSENCTDKHQATDGLFKPMVRIFKNMRSRLLDDGALGEEIAPSYFIEGLLYNVPTAEFNGDYGDTFCNCINWLVKADRYKFVCPNRMHWLFRKSGVQWSADKCDQFLDALVDLWRGW